MAISKILSDLLEQDKFAKFTKTGNTTATLGSLTLGTAISGPGGIDTGSVAASTFYYVYTIVHSNSIKLIASISSTSPTGFTQYKKVGAFVTDSSSNIGKAYYYGEQALSRDYAVRYSGSMTPASSLNQLITGHTLISVDSPLLAPTTVTNPGLRFPAGYYGKRVITIIAYGRSDVGSSSNFSIGLTTTPGMTQAGVVWNHQASASSGEYGGFTNYLELPEGYYTEDQRLMYVSISSSPDPAQNLARVQAIVCIETFKDKPDWSRV